MSLYFTPLPLPYAFPQALDTLFMKRRLSCDVGLSISKLGQAQVSWNGWPPHVRVKAEAEGTAPAGEEQCESNKGLGVRKMA